MQQKVQGEQRKKGNKSLMSRNVTEFRHLLSKAYITENDLNWAIGLRDNPIPKNIEHKQPSVPEVYFKKTAISTIRQQKKAKEPKFTFNAGEYQHMLLKKIEKSGSKQTLDQLHFYTDLRHDPAYQKRDISSKSHKQFDVLPFHDRRDLPTFIKKQSIKKTRQISKNDMQVGLDGAHHQQPYTQKILRNRNYGFFQPFTKVKGRGKVSLPSLAWQIGLRNYR